MSYIEPLAGYRRLPKDPGCDCLGCDSCRHGVGCTRFVLPNRKHACSWCTMEFFGLYNEQAERR